MANLIVTASQPLSIRKLLRLTSPALKASTVDAVSVARERKGMKERSDRHCDRVALACADTGLLTAAALVASLLLLGVEPVPPALAQTSTPPASLVALERQVSLKIAHVRIQGP